MKPSSNYGTPLRIGVFMHDYLPQIGGAQVSAHCLSNSLSVLGQSVTVFADHRRVKECHQRGWKFKYAIESVRRVPGFIATRLPRVGTFCDARTMANRVVRHNLDMVQIIVAWPWLAVAPDVKRWTGVPIAVRAAGDDIQVDASLDYGIRRDPNVGEILRRGFTSVDCGISISNTVSKEYANIGMQAENIIEIPPGVDYTRYDNHHVDRVAVRQKWGIPTDRKIVLSVGRNHPKKGFLDLLSALTILNRVDNQFAVVIVGNNSADLLSHADMLGIKDAFYPLPEMSDPGPGHVNSFPTNELIDIYKAADYFVLPSYLETYANVALEAMTAAIPVIVTDAPGCIETVKDGQDGLIVPIGAPNKIADSIIMLEQNPELRANLVKGGLAKAKSQDWDVIASRYLDVYRSLKKQRQEIKARSGTAL